MMECGSLSYHLFSLESTACHWRLTIKKDLLQKRFATEGGVGNVMVAYAFKTVVIASTASKQFKTSLIISVSLSSDWILSVAK